MSVFNSLGSNYSKGFVLKNLLRVPRGNSKTKLAEVLASHYGGKVTLTFKGREALELALRRSGLKPGSKVGVNGFTCYVVYEAVVNAGYEVVSIDIAKGRLNFGLEELKSAHGKDKNLKAVIIQNTLGYPADAPAINKYCAQNDILLIEDLAHSTGAVYSNGIEAGKAGSFTMMSFSQDKPLDAVAGGALVDRRENQESVEQNLGTVSLLDRIRLRSYPLLTGLIRSTYSIGLGRAIHYVCKKLKLLSTPMSDHIKGIHAMSSGPAGSILANWNSMNNELAHRREIAKVYDTELPTLLKYEAPIGNASYLRYPIVVNDRQSLINFLKQQGIYIGDTWYDAPIGPKKYMIMTSYKKGECPLSEYLSEHIVNLPTHLHVNPEKAAFICAKIKQWSALQQKK